MSLLTVEALQVPGLSQEACKCHVMRPTAILASLSTEQGRVGWWGGESTAKDRCFEQLGQYAAPSATVVTA